MKFNEFFFKIKEMKKKDYLEKIYISLTYYKQPIMTDLKFCMLIQLHRSLHSK